LHTGNVTFTVPHPNDNDGINSLTANTTGYVFNPTLKGMFRIYNGSTLQRETTLYQGHGIRNSDALFVMQNDGKAASYNSTGLQMATYGDGTGSYVKFKSEGDLVVYNINDSLVGTSNTNGINPANLNLYLQLETNGSLTIKVDNKTVWNSSWMASNRYSDAYESKDRPGYDIGYYNTSVGQCKNICNNTGNCTGIVTSKDNTYGCWLKNSVNYGELVTNTNRNTYEVSIDSPGDYWI
jgi:hypothetical protein